MGRDETVDWARLVGRLAKLAAFTVVEREALTLVEEGLTLAWGTVLLLDKLTLLVEQELLTLTLVE